MKQIRFGGKSSIGQITRAASPKSAVRLAVNSEAGDDGSMTGLALESIVLQHLPQVSMLARKIRDRYHPHAELGDLVGYGVVGLMSAIQRFDASRGILLKTYAEHLIRGAILDGVRGIHWLSRSAYRDRSAYQREAEEGEPRCPGQPEAVGRRDPPLMEIICAGARLDVFEKLSEEREMLHPAQDTPAALYERKELAARLSKAIGGLPERQSQIIDLYYRQGLDMLQIGDTIDVHPSRVSQFHTGALHRLRRFLRKGQLVSSAVTSRL